MADAARNKTQVHDDAAEALIVKLILDPSLVGAAKNEARAELIDTFLKEYNDFVNRRGPTVRPTAGTKSIHYSRQRFWESLHVLSSLKF